MALLDGLESVVISFCCLSVEGEDADAILGFGFNICVHKTSINLMCNLKNINAFNLHIVFEATTLCLGVHESKAYSTLHEQQQLAQNSPILNAFAQCTCHVMSLISLWSGTRFLCKACYGYNTAVRFYERLNLERKIQPLTLLEISTNNERCCFPGCFSLGWDVSHFSRITRYEA